MSARDADSRGGRSRTDGGAHQIVAGTIMACTGGALLAATLIAFLVSVLGDWSADVSRILLSATIMLIALACTAVTVSVQLGLARRAEKHVDKRCAQLLSVIQAHENSWSGDINDARNQREAARAAIEQNTQWLRDVMGALVAILQRDGTPPATAEALATVHDLVQRIDAGPAGNNGNHRVRPGSGA